MKARMHGLTALEQLRRAARLDPDRFGALLQAAEAAVKETDEELAAEAMARG